MKKQLTIQEVARMGGLARGRLPKERLSELGKKAVNARWNKVRKLSTVLLTDTNQ